MTDTVPHNPCLSIDCLPGKSAVRVRELAAEFNRSCFCITLDRDAMANAMQAVAFVPDFYATYIVSRPHLFANVPVFLPEADRDAMLAIVHAIEATARLPAYVDAVLQWAPDIAPPSERLVKIGDTAVSRKIDVRLYTYQGRMLLAAARLYQGQTTNFRTEGGGFAPVNFL